MVGSSELSDALNPNYSTRRQHIVAQNVHAPRHSDASHLPSPTLPIQRVSGSLAVNSSLPLQLDNAFAVSPLTPETSSGSPTQHVRSPIARPEAVKQRQDPAQILRNIMMSFSEQRQAIELEKERRFAWEAEQERKAANTQAEFERRLSSMQMEIEDLRSRLPPATVADRNADGANLTGHPHVAVPRVSLNTYSLPTPAEPNEDYDKDVSPSYARDAYSLPEFVQGSSTSPSITSIEDGQPRKRLRTKPREDIAGPSSSKLLKAYSRQTQPRSIHAAMRTHFLRCMELENDKLLPPSFPEGETLRDDEPVRFVWHQTARKSVHNGRMKKRIISDLIHNRAMYPLVPAQDFTEKRLDSVFEQAFTTFRTKFSSQATSQWNDDGKAQKARRRDRKKIKLSNRESTRKLFDEYSTAFFDAAFQMECMSSEESSEGESGEEGHTEDEHPKGTLTIRYLAWRSSRLLKLYELIDEREEFERSRKPKRGVGRKSRRVGRPKDGDPPPPLGVFKWMVSKNWYRSTQSRSTHLANLLKTNVHEDEDAAWMSLAPLGPESDLEDNSLPAVYGGSYYGPHNWAGGLGFTGMAHVLPS